MAVLMICLLLLIESHDTIAFFLATLNCWRPLHAYLNKTYIFPSFSASLSSSHFIQNLQFCSGPCFELSYVEFLYVMMFCLLLSAYYDLKVDINSFYNWSFFLSIIDHFYRRYTECFLMSQNLCWIPISDGYF